ncbi:MAG: hypothetical protein Q9164_000222 [Protoblastenia rupestris]
MDSISSQTLDELLRRELNPEPLKKELNPEGLIKCGIEFREKEEPSREAIASIAPLQAELLDFQHLEFALRDAQSSQSSPSDNSSEKYRRRLDNACLMSREAKDMRKGDEDLWVIFIKQRCMQCIWSGDIRKVLDATKLCSIVDKVAEWFFYIYRPWVSACLDQWKAEEAEKRLKMAHESFMNIRMLSQVGLGAMTSSDSNDVAEVSTKSSTPISLPYIERWKGVPPTSFGGSLFGSRGFQDISDSSSLGPGHSRNTVQKSSFHFKFGSEDESNDKISGVNPFGSDYFTKLGERSSFLGSCGSPASRDNDRLFPNNNKGLSTGAFDSSTSKGNNGPYIKGLFGSAPSKSEKRLSTGNLFGVSSSNGLFSSHLSNSNEKLSAEISGSPAVKTKERPSSEVFGLPSPSLNRKPPRRIIVNLPAPKNTKKPSNSPPLDEATHLSRDKPKRKPSNKGRRSASISSSEAPSPQFKSKRKPSNKGRRSISIPSSEDIEKPSSSGTLDSSSSEYDEQFARSGAASIGRDRHGNLGSEAARAGYYYRTP